MEENQQAWDLPWGRTVSKRTIWRPALTIQSFIRICGRPLVWFAMANEFCRLGQLDISPLFARVGHPEFTECSTPFVFHHPLVRPFSTRARTTHYIIYTYTYIYLYLYISIYIYLACHFSTSCDHRLERRPGTLRRELLHWFWSSCRETGRVARVCLIVTTMHPDRCRPTLPS